MNLKELIELNKNQFKESTVIQDLSEDTVIMDFNNKLKVQFIIENNMITIIILKQDERYWNRDENFKYNNKFNFQSFNGWEIRTNSCVYLNIYNNIIELKGYDLEDNNQDWSTYYNESNIINLILALEDWSINCPFFKEEIKEESKLNNTYDFILERNLEYIGQIDKLKAQLIAKENEIEELKQKYKDSQERNIQYYNEINSLRKSCDSSIEYSISLENELKYTKKVLLEIIKGA